VIVWNLATGRQHATLSGHTQPVNAVACTYLPDGTPLAITGAGVIERAGNAGEVIVWNLATGRQHTTLIGHTQTVNAVACTHLPDGTPLAITGAGAGLAGNAGNAGEVIVWNLATGRQHSTLIGHKQPVNAVACTHLPDGTALAITGAGSIIDGPGEVIFWNLAAGQPRNNLTMPYPAYALACDLNYGVVVGAGTEVIRLEYATGH
jgi:WD40 repeat protein